MSLWKRRDAYWHHLVASGVPMLEAYARPLPLELQSPPSSQAAAEPPPHDAHRAAAPGRQPLPATRRRPPRPSRG